MSSSYGMDHKEFTAATGLADGDAVIVTYADGEKRAGRVIFGWYGPDFDSVKVSSGQIHADGSERGDTVHMETHGPYPFNRIDRPTDIESACSSSSPEVAAFYRAGVVVEIEANGQRWNNRTTEVSRLRLRRQQAKRQLDETPRTVNRLIDEIAKLDGEIEAMERGAVQAPSQGASA